MAIIGKVLKLQLISILGGCAVIIIKSILK